MLDVEGIFLDDAVKLFVEFSPKNLKSLKKANCAFALALWIITVDFLFVGFGFEIMIFSDPFSGSLIWWFGFALEIVGVLVLLSLVRC